MAILAGLFAALFGRLLGRWRGAVVALACIAVYTVLVGAGASVVRAALMGGLTLFAAQLGRRQEGLNTLASFKQSLALIWGMLVGGGVVTWIFITDGVKM